MTRPLTRPLNRSAAVFASVALGSLGLLGLNACADPGATNTPGPEPSASEPPLPSDTPVTVSSVPTPPTITVNPGTLKPAPSRSPSAPSASVLKLGQWWHFDDGLRTRIVQVSPVAVGRVAYGARPGSPALLVEVTLHNGSPESVAADVVRVLLTYGPNGAQAAEVTDGQERPFTGVVPPAGYRTARYVFAVPKQHRASPVLVEVHPSVDHGAAWFKGTPAK